jgi:hypothetical protein
LRPRAGSADADQTFVIQSRTARLVHGSDKTIQAPAHGLEQPLAFFGE